MHLWKKQPSWVQISADFSKFPYSEIMGISSLFNRCDVIADRYLEGSLKVKQEKMVDLEQGSLSHLMAALRFLRISSANS